ncbi:MAG: hypothetical protein DHS20C01_12710 [marine bacterium B5-7]|nr:MAG: hypothetical protein DHS20C01_12710 [marine bacterium B5-7]
MPLSSTELEARLEDVLDAVLSSRRTVSDAARAIAILDDESQTFALRWLDSISASNTELAYQYVNNIGRALGVMSRKDVEAWIVEALDIYDQQGLFPASHALGEIDSFADRRSHADRVVELESVTAFLETFLRGLSGRKLTVTAGDTASTDSETVFLPRRLNRLASASENRFLYKVMATNLWAMNRFGTFRRSAPSAPTLAQRLAEFPDKVDATKLFYLIETERLNACISRELPGLWREIERDFSYTRRGLFKRACEDLARIDATVDDTLYWLKRMLDERAERPPAAPYQGSADLDTLNDITDQRLDTERTALEELIQDLIDQMNRDDVGASGDDDADIRLELDNDGTVTDYQLTVDGEPMPMPAALREQIDAILQDLESVPEDWLNPAEGDAVAEADGNDQTIEEQREDSRDPMFLYDEWDYQRGHYRKDWCTLYERQVKPGDPEFFNQTLHQYHGLTLELRRAFEMLKDQQHTLRRQPEGEDIDLDAVIQASADQHLGRELSDRLFLKTHRQERDIAVMLMVDLSGSTKGWIVDAEREAVILLCEALEVLGDRYGIYGFSGMTRKRCELFRIKTLNEPLNDNVKARIAGMEPRDYTRMGVTIRHLTHLMDSIDARTRLLITLSDGKPDDYDGYRGDYGIEDTRKALIEARNRGIHPFCITIDQKAGEYLPHMYGAVNYTVVDDVRKLPTEVSRVYYRLTR